MVDKHIDKLIETRDILNDVGNGFCLQKWRNVTLYLHMGDNHSCYHPQPNRVPVEEVLANPKAIHNSKFKKQVRKEMLEGKKPSECYYCWNVEELEGNHYSDRMIHNSSTWLDAKKETEEIRNMPWDADVNPYYVEVSFGAGCNFKCGYCCPQASSQWQDEIEKHGNYDISFNQYGIDYLEHTKVYKDDEYNPYVEAWWEWWPELKKDLKVLRLTGGEALLNPNTMKMFKLIQESDDCQHLEINLNSNMGVSTGRVTRLAEAVKAMLENKKIKDFKLYTSLEAWDERAEYMRRGLRMKQWIANVETYLEIVPDTPISVMCTYNILSVASFRPFLENILRLRKKWNKTPGNNRIIFDTPYLKEPPHWMINLLPQSFGKYIDEDLQFISDNISTDGVTGFWDVEYEKLKRVRDYFYQGGARVTDKVIRNGRKDFYNFFTEYDKRSDLSLLQTFPEYEDFYYLCQELVESDSENLIPVKEI
jgi:organic radical activating enzyme